MRTDPFGLATRIYEVLEMTVQEGHTIDTVIAEITVSTTVDTSRCNGQCGRCEGNATATVYFEWRPMTDDREHLAYVGELCDGMNCTTLEWQAGPNGGILGGRRFASREFEVPCDGGSRAGRMHVITSERGVSDWLDQAFDEDAPPPYNDRDDLFREFRRVNTYFVVNYSVGLSSDNCGELDRDDVRVSIPVVQGGLAWPRGSDRIREKTSD